MSEHFEASYPFGKPGSAERRRFEQSFNRQYHPCEIGIHVCGYNEGLPHGPHFTILNLPMDELAATAAFALLKVEFEVSDEDGEVLVDLNTTSGCSDNFWMRRQMIESMQRRVANLQELPVDTERVSTP